ncbi:hypothetical protein MLD38_027811 [Melastoma candidum]|uniref:Uncharacterized protein n=1 Tax=Melastoma candidum TaxID=119954 RepID=A0ACB9P2Y4_9MYRT|nr:hypothetical protein MLD38_027811 [Melastoma candidum]
MATPGDALPPPAPSSHVTNLINSTPPRGLLSPSRAILSDRFIPSRSSSNLDLVHLDSSKDLYLTPYKILLRAALFGSPATPDISDRISLGAKSWGGGAAGVSVGYASRNVFRYKIETRQPLDTSPFRFRAGSGEGVGIGVGIPGSSEGVKSTRKVPRSPCKVLDAPALQDDFYLNLVDWSSNNVLAVGLGNCIYLWNASSSKVTKLCDLGIDDSVCSVGWAQRGSNLAVGTSNGKLQVWDASCCKKVRTMEGHRLRVGALAWSASMLSSGSRDKTILQRDLRTSDDFVSKLSGHKSEVCGLKWSYDNQELASGGNDNRLLVWNQHSNQPMLKFCEHTAAVKAISWSPHLHGLLASGGGTADRCIRFWNTKTNSQLSCIDTGGQVCNLAWSKNVNELVSTHGYSQNQIIVWRYPSMSKLAILTGHTYRVLYLAISPDGQTIVTGAGDETLRFWDVFPSPKSQNTNSDIGSSFFGRTTIR